MSEELFAAIQSGDQEAVRSLLERHSEMRRARDSQGVSFILQALYHRQPEIAELMANGRDDLDLHEAVAVGDGARVEGLLGADASLLESRSPDGFTPLHFAAFFGRAELAKLLLERGAEADVEADNPMKVHPLHSAAAANANGICRALLEHGADPNALQQLGYTALMTAAMHGNEELVRMLLESGAHAETVAEDGKSAPGLAEEHGHQEVLALLAGQPA